MYLKYVCKIEFWSSTNIFITNQLASMILAPPLSIKGRHSTHKQMTHPQCRIADCAPSLAPLVIPAFLPLKIVAAIHFIFNYAVFPLG